MKGSDVESQDQQQMRSPLLEKAEDQQKQQAGSANSSMQKAINQTFKSTAHLANLLPTGTVLAFQLLSPVFTNQGRCTDASRFMAASLLSLCGISCFLLSFTDSFKRPDGTVRHGIATPRGFLVLDGDGDAGGLASEKAAEFRIRWIDFVHAFASLLVFAAVALLDQNVVGCFYPLPSAEMKEVLSSLPMGIGVLCSMLFVAFPTKRHGIGFPLTPSSD
ncbi:hypothetical protein EJ110_NYTH08143 [Nymphaea thermarum]|nr:hypothetical protein EJ110_NYTH08143 [Nymphaea thermarum]